MSVEKAISLARSQFYELIQLHAELEGVAVTLPQAQEIVEFGSARGFRFDEVLIVRNLARAWRFILDNSSKVPELGYQDVAFVHRLLTTNLVDMPDAGRLRNCSVRVTHSRYVPPILNVYEFNNSLLNIAYYELSSVDKAFAYFCFLSRSQGFIDGNKRTAFLVANWYLLSTGIGILKVPKNQALFKEKLVVFYETNDCKDLVRYLKRYALEVV